MQGHSQCSRFDQEVQSAQRKQRLQWGERRAVSVSSDMKIPENITLTNRTRGLKGIIQQDSWRKTCKVQKYSIRFPMVRPGNGLLVSIVAFSVRLESCRASRASLEQ